MMRKELAQLAADITGRPVTTIENGLIPKLQAAELVGSEVDATYKVNVLLAAIVDRDHGVSPAAAVRHWRGLPLTSGDDDFARYFEIDITSAGAALDSILANVSLQPTHKSPILEAMLAKAGGEITLAVEFYSEHLVLRFYGKTSGKPARDLIFGTEPAADNTRIERISRLFLPAFVRLAG